MSLCQDKSLTHKVLKAAGLNLPSQQLAGNADDSTAFLGEHERVVVKKPLDGEQGQGVAVDLRTIEGSSKPSGISPAVRQPRAAGKFPRRSRFADCGDPGFEVVAAAIRRPAEVVGDGQHSIGALIEAQSRRRQAATSGESKIPLDHETERTLQAAGYDYNSILPAGEHLFVRRTANLHTVAFWRMSRRSCIRP